MATALFRVRTERILGETYGYFYPHSDHVVKWKKTRTSPRGEPIDPSGLLEKICQRNDCPFGPYRRIPGSALELAWTGGPMGDFTSAIGPVLALRSVGEELAARFGGLDLLPICVTKPKGERGMRIQEKVWHLKPTRVIQYNPELSTLELKAGCDVCGRRSYRILGTETDPGEELIGERWEPVPGRPRRPGNGVLLPRSAIEGTPIFLYEPFTLVTDDVRRFIEAKGWTNVRFLEYGEVVDG
jgi:hypothetical protein